MRVTKNKRGQHTHTVAAAAAGTATNMCAHTEVTKHSSGGDQIKTRAKKVKIKMCDKNTKCIKTQVS
jgi:hypothetical protein